MVSPISLQPNIRGGICPHGVPQSSCHICNKVNSGGMGHGSSVKHNNKPEEWSYQKCYVAGLEIKAAKMRRINTVLPIPVFRLFCFIDWANSFS